MCITLWDSFASKSFFLRCSKIFTSMSAWWWNLFLFLQGRQSASFEWRNKARAANGCTADGNGGMRQRVYNWATRVRNVIESDSRSMTVRRPFAHLMILMAMYCPLLWSNARITWPKLPFPITSCISYLNKRAYPSLVTTIVKLTRYRNIRCSIYCERFSSPKKLERRTPFGTRGNERKQLHLPQIIHRYSLSNVHATRSCSRLIEIIITTTVDFSFHNNTLDANSNVPTRLRSFHVYGAIAR